MQTAASVVSFSWLYVDYLRQNDYKMQRRGLTFLQKSKIKTLGNRKTIFFSVKSFQKILTFHISVSSENTLRFVGTFLYCDLDHVDLPFSDRNALQINNIRFSGNIETNRKTSCPELLIIQRMLVSF